MYPTDTVLEKTQKAFFVKVYCVFVVCQSYDVLNDGTSFILNIFSFPVIVLSYSVALYLEVETLL